MITHVRTNVSSSVTLVAVLVVATLLLQSTASLKKISAFVVFFFCTTHIFFLQNARALVRKCAHIFARARALNPPCEISDYSSNFLEDEA